MTTPFHISYAWDPRDKPLDFEPSDYEDWSALFRTMRRLIALHRGIFTLQIGERELRYFFDPDLSTIFEELPAALTALAAGPQATASIDFFEQGTEQLLMLARNGPALAIELYTGHQTPGRPPERFVVAVHEFLGAWAGFGQALLAALAELEPAIGADEGFRQYATDLAAVKAAVPGNAA